MYEGNRVYLLKINDEINQSLGRILKEGDEKDKEPPSLFIFVTNKIKQRF